MNPMLLSDLRCLGSGPKILLAHSHGSLKEDAFVLVFFFLAGRPVGRPALGALRLQDGAVDN